MFCKNCGKEITDDAKFCKYCGKKVKSNDKKSGNIQNVSQNNESSDNTLKYAVIGIVIIIIAIIVSAAALGVFNIDTYSNDGNSVEDTNGGDEVSKVSLSSFPVSEAPNLAQQISNSGSYDGISFKGVTLTKSQVLYILTKSVSMIASGNENGTINVGNPSYAAHPAAPNIGQTISKSQYVDMSNRFSSWIERNGQVPNYVGINSGGVRDVSPIKMLDIDANVLLEYKKTGSLPETAQV